jgi:hypothetical protein
MLNMQPADIKEMHTQLQSAQVCNCWSHLHSARHSLRMQYGRQVGRPMWRRLSIFHGPEDLRSHVAIFGSMCMLL